VSGDGFDELGKEEKPSMHAKVNNNKNYFFIFNCVLFEKLVFNIIQ